MGEHSRLDDLSAMCEFEITLRNLLAREKQIRTIMEHRCGSAVGLGLLDAVFTDVEPLVAVMAVYRDMLATGRSR